MRNEPLKFRTYIPHFGDTLDISGLAMLEPFGYIEWGRHKVYLVPSMRSIHPYPSNYIMKSDYDDDECIRVIYDSEVACIGSFYNSMTKKEQAQFDENIVPIFNLLGFE